MNYEEYKIIWKDEIGIKNNMNTVEKGRLFSTELFTQYLDVSLLDDNLYYIDGKSDGGIDLAITFV